MKVKVHSAINTVRAASEDELLTRALENGVPVTYFYYLLDRYKDVTLELEIKELNGLDIREDSGAYVGHTLGALNYEFYNEEKIRLKDGTELVFPLTVEAPTGYEIIIYTDDLPKYEQRETTLDIVLNALGIKRYRPVG